ncbi:DEAD/DEAH box helicase family protein [Moorena sp. SIO4G3]|uniref:DEAD/DEAH box helicase family protein n=1 Tax=Moorena sp. SIO4G3 TaxID=2607821 RepID=UPI00142A505F|nr:DEAD/DEAH box helicase family protein [Moorena sp. SIO4G3]NEO75939.1 DEAD/DEAH box helicase family protein [Moorena sp. SIO4G3]
MTSNFDFLSNQFPQLYNYAKEAESLTYSAPRASCFYTRFTLEQAVVWLYDNDAYLKPPYENNLGALIHEQTFKDNLKPGLFPKVRLIHKIGNLAAHSSSKITKKDSLRVVEDLFHFLYWLCRYYSGSPLAPLNKGGTKSGGIVFDPTVIPDPKTQQDLSIAQLQELETKLNQASEMRSIAEKRQKQTEEELETLKAEIKKLKQQNETVPDNHNYNEADTRRYTIDVLLKEAGWDIDQPDWKEYPVQGMPNDTGNGYVDYVLWGDDGKPLALVEAKRSSVSPKTGQHQAELYAECLEKQFNQRPVIFYSNGDEHWIWDDYTYPPRPIQGFLKKDELERIIFRRTHRKSLNVVIPSKDIAGRCYQREAIRRITETFDQHKKRKALLVMATGTGKTRVAISLVDLLMRGEWVKRVLFLADRTPLLTQALRNFKSHLPNVTAVDITKNKKDADSANVVLSTYPTMFNCISGNNSSNLQFSPGYFDLVIVDEAHRSIYKKYQALFEYFDSLLVGLTATPRNEIHRDTYGIFDLEAGIPTFAYELKDAIADNYLVPPQGIKVPFKFLRQGINYNQLSEAEREDYEEKFRDEETGEIPDQVNAAAINKWLFNGNTIDQALELLMEKGLKVEGGDRLGKTIIFARNHSHAEFIVERFDQNYPHYKGKFAQVIDSHNSYAQSLLDDFSESNKEPTIAVSVDMLDTGVDVPEVVNLVFFKPVYSRVKFNQMIGRGTRLCPELFGVEQDKDNFLIFDLCSNFDYFSQDIKESDPKPPESLTAQIFNARLRLNDAITESNKPEYDQLRDSLLDKLHHHVATMEKGNFNVRRHLQTVEYFSDRTNWNNLNQLPSSSSALGSPSRPPYQGGGQSRIETPLNSPLTQGGLGGIQTLASLPNGLPKENEGSKRFDLLCLKIQLAILKKSRDFIQLRDKVRDLLDRLEEKQTIPMVKQQLPLIEDVREETWWSDVTPSQVESLRVSLRDLIKFIDKKEQNIIVYTNFEDELGEVVEVDVPSQQTGFSREQYHKKVKTYIKNNEDHITIAKLKRNVPLTEADLTALEEMLFTAEEIGGRDRFFEMYGQDISLKLFIRKIVGLDRNAAKEAFSKYLQVTNFSANQIRFVETIIDYLTQNGVMDPGLLYEAPFTDLHYEGLDGVFNEDDADLIITTVRSFNETVDDQLNSVA